MPEAEAASEPALDRFALAARTKREKSRKAILDAAERLIERDGYAATTVNAIAKEASVGLATLYSHHPTKASLAAELFRQQLAREADPLDDDPNPPAGQQDRLQAELGRLARTAAKHPGTAEAVLQASSGPPTRAERAKAPAEGRERVPTEVDLADTIRRGQKSGDFRKDVDADELSRILTTAVLDRVVARTDDDPDLVAKQITSVFLTGITGNRTK